VERLRVAEPEHGELAPRIESGLGGEAGALEEDCVAIVGLIDALELSGLAGVLVDDLLDLRDGNLGQESRVEPHGLDGTWAKNARDSLLWGDRRGSLSDRGERDQR